MDGDKSEKVITVRMTHELREALKDLAWRQRTTMNKLCVEVLRGAIEAGKLLTASER